MARTVVAIAMAAPMMASAGWPTRMRMNFFESQWTSTPATAAAMIAPTMARILQGISSPSNACVLSSG